MEKAVYESAEGKQLAIREKVLRYRYLDDAFMSVALNDKETIKVVLDIIMERELRIISVQAQDTVANLYGRGVRFDVFAEDADGIVYDIEIQRASDGANPKRARFNAAMLDSRSLNKGVDYKNLPQTVIIFITETDTLGDKLPIQHFHVTSDETGKRLRTGQEIIYVDSSCQADTPLGNLMHDFRCRDAKDIKNKALAERMEKLKNNETEVTHMCQVMEEYGITQRTEGRIEGKVADVRMLMRKMRLSMDEVFDLLEVPNEERAEYRALLANQN